MTPYQEGQQARREGMPRDWLRDDEWLRGWDDEDFKGECDED